MFEQKTVSQSFTQQFQHYYGKAYSDIEATAHCFLLAYNHSLTQNNAPTLTFVDKLALAATDLMGNELSKLRGKHAIKHLLKKHSKEVFTLIEQYNTLCNAGTMPTSLKPVASRLKEYTTKDKPTP